jgi:phospholipid/cholesterol/gamma-HCH transport system substrate-binding protein
MNASRLEWKVGLFVALGLVLLAGLLIRFSRGASLFAEKTYQIRLKTRNVGGIQPGAYVLMAGVGIGRVGGTELEPPGTNVTVRLKIPVRFQIHRDALFTIEQSGFLGDQYVAVTPRQNSAPVLQDGDEVWCEEPFNLQEAARSALGLIQRVDLAVQRLDGAITRIDRLLLGEETLTNLTATIANLRTLSGRALGTLDKADGLLDANAPALRATSSNLVLFSTQLAAAGADLQTLVSTNRDDITAAVKNVEAASLAVKEVLDDLEAGRGLAGSLLKNEDLARQLSTLSSNLAVTSSNLNSRGLWGILWKPKEARPKR